MRFWLALTVAFICATLGPFAWVTAWAQHAPPPSSRVDLVFAGDTALDGAVGTWMERGIDPFTDVAPWFAQADIRLLNLECVVATQGQAVSKFYTFRAHPRVLNTLQRHVDGVTLANNHSGDFGRDAFAQMLGLLQSHQLHHAGGGLNLAQAHRPWIVERKGLRIAILSYNEFMPRSYEATSQSPGVAWSEDAQVLDDIRQARRKQGADIVLPFMHWGWENEPTANTRQRTLARLMLDAGADAVIGGHPHVTQDVEVYKGKPIIYSVGNFMMEATDNDAQRQGWLLRLNLERGGVTGFQTQAIQLDRQGVPTLNVQARTPCWQREWAAPQNCASPLRTDDRSQRKE